MLLPGLLLTIAVANNKFVKYSKNSNHKTHSTNKLNNNTSNKQQKTQIKLFSLKTFLLYYCHSSNLVFNSCNSNGIRFSSSPFSLATFRGYNFFVGYRDGVFGLEILHQKHLLHASTRRRMVWTKSNIKFHLILFNNLNPVNKNTH